MAAQRYTSTTTIQPAPTVGPARVGVTAEAEAQGWQQLSQTALTAYDMLRSQEERDAQRKAIEDAPGIIKRDGNYALIPPSSFYPEGFTSRAYRDSYRSQAVAIYSQLSAQEFQQTIDQARAASPTNHLAMKAATDTKKEAMLAHLDPSVAPLMLLRFNAMQGQALSSVMAAQEQADLGVKRTLADNSYQEFVRDMSRTAALNPQQKPEDFYANNQLLAARWEQNVKPLFAAAGMTEAQIEQARNDAIYKAIVSADYESYRKAVLTTTQGGARVLDSGEMLAMRNHILESSKGMPAQYQALYRQSMEGALTAAGIDAQLAVSAFNQNQTATNQARALKESESLARAEQAAIAFNNPLILENEKARIKAAQLDAYSDPNLSVAGRMQLVSSMQTLGTMAASAAQPIYQQNALALGAIAGDIGQPLARRVSAINEMQATVDDPDQQHTLPIGVRSYLQGQIIDWNRQQPTSDVMVWASKAKSGKQDIAVTADQMQKLLDDGLIGPHGAMKPETALQIYGEARDAWAKNQGEIMLAGEAAQQAQKFGRVPDEEAARAIRSQNPFGAGSWPDLADPAVQGKLQDYVKRFLVVPDEVKKQLLGGPVAGEGAQELIAQHVAVYQKIAAGVQDRFGWNNDWTRSVMRKLIGEDKANFLALGGKIGPENASDKAVKDQPSISRNTPAGEPKTATSVTDKVRAFAAGIAKNQDVPIEQWFPSQYRPTDATRAGEQSMSLYFAQTGGLDHGWLQRYLGRTSISSLLGLSSEVTLGLDPEVEASITRLATDKLERNGKEYEILGSEGAVAEAVRQAYFEHREKLSVNESIDRPGTMELGWKSFKHQTGSDFGLPGPASDSMTAGYAAGLLRYRAQTLNSSPGPDGTIAPGYDSAPLYDAGSLRVKRHIDKNGGESWVWYGSQNGGIPRILMELPVDSPLFGTFAGRIREEVSRNLRNQFPDFDFTAQGLAYLSGLAVGDMVNDFPARAIAKGWSYLAGPALRTTMIEDMLDRWKSRPGPSNTAQWLRNLTGILKNDDVQLGYRKSTRVEGLEVLDRLNPRPSDLPDIPEGMQAMFPLGIGPPGSDSFAAYRKEMNRREENMRLERAQQDATTPPPEPHGIFRLRMLARSGQLFDRTQLRHEMRRLVGLDDEAASSSGHLLGARYGAGGASAP